MAGRSGESADRAGHRESLLAGNLWHRHCRTAEDFGSQGEPPSHPELLDWLAVDFRESGWDVKKLFRLMVTSATYRQSADATPEESEERSRQPAALARTALPHGCRDDSRLALLRRAGCWCPKIGGPSVKPYQPPKVWETVAMDRTATRDLRAGHGDKLYRRSLYTFWKRSAPPAFDGHLQCAVREECTVRRERTNTPLQALVTMNDPQFVEAARVLAQNALLAAPKSVDATTRLSGRPRCWPGLRAQRSAS